MELLVVIAIIAILAGMLFPVFKKAKDQSHGAACVSNLKQLSNAFRMYADDNSGTLPSPRQSYWPESWVGAEGLSGPVNLPEGQLWDYVRATGIYVCPSDRGRPAERVLSKAQNAGDPDMQDYATERYPLSYSMNDTLYDYSRIPATTLKTDRIAHGSKIMLLIHESRATIDDGAFYWGPDAESNTAAEPSDVHNEGSNLAYVDGHVAWLTLADMKYHMTRRTWCPFR